MSLEFDPRSGFAQKEDKIGELLIPRKSSQTPPTHPPYNKPTENSSTVTSISGIGVDDLYAEWDRYALDFPPGLVLLPGNEVHIAVSTDTEYEKKDTSNHFGLKCQAVGYEWTSVTADVSVYKCVFVQVHIDLLLSFFSLLHTLSQCLLLLEKELVALGAMCASSMLKEDTVLPFAG